MKAHFNTWTKNKVGRYHFENFTKHYLSRIDKDMREHNLLSPGETVTKVKLIPRIEKFRQAYFDTPELRRKNELVHNAYDLCLSIYQHYVSQVNYDYHEFGNWLSKEGFKDKDKLDLILEARLLNEKLFNTGVLSGNDTIEYYSKKAEVNEIKRKYVSALKGGKLSKRELNFIDKVFDYFIAYKSEKAKIYS